MMSSSEGGNNVVVDDDDDLLGEGQTTDDEVRVSPEEAEILLRDDDGNNGDAVKTGNFESGELNVSTEFRAAESDTDLGERNVEDISGNDTVEIDDDDEIEYLQTKKIDFDLEVKPKAEVITLDSDEDDDDPDVVVMDDDRIIGIPQAEKEDVKKEIIRSGIARVDATTLSTSDRIFRNNRVTLNAISGRKSSLPPFLFKGHINNPKFDKMRESALKRRIHPDDEFPLVESFRPSKRPKVIRRRLILRRIPLPWDEKRLRNSCSGFGTVIKAELRVAERIGIVLFENPDSAAKCFKHFMTHEIDGCGMTAFLAKEATNERQ